MNQSMRSHLEVRPLNPAPDNLPTIEEALRRGTEFLRPLGVDSPRLEMEWILARVCGLDRLGIYMNMQRVLSEAEVTAES